MKYLVTLKGCHESTELEMFLEPAEADAYRRLAAASVAASTGECEPVLLIREA